MPDMDWAQLQQLAENEKFEPLPDGQTFVFVVEKGEMKATNSGNGQNISLKCKVAEGPESGRTSFANVFIPSPNSDVKPGAFGMMAAKLNAIGVPLQVLAQHGANPQQVGLLFVGKMFLGTISHREWPKGSGQFRDGIDTIAPLPGSAGGATPSQFAPGAASIPNGGVPASQPPDSSISESGSPKPPW